MKHFDREGKLTHADFATSVGREARTAVRPADGEAVVLVRLPVTLEPAGGEAIAEQVRYGAEGLSISVSSPQGTTLYISDGPLTIATVRRHTATISGRPTPPEFQGDRLILRIAAGSGVHVQVSPSE